MTWIVLALFLLGFTVVISVFIGRQPGVSRRDSDADMGTFLPMSSAVLPDNDVPSTTQEAWQDQDRDERLGTAGDDHCPPGSNDSGSSGSDSSSDCDSGGGDSGGGSE